MMLPAERYKQPDPGAVLRALQEITARHGYLPQAEVRQAAIRLGVPLSQLFGAATFYAGFSFTPCGRHRLQVCEGTACYIRGAATLLAHLEAELGIAPGQSTADLAFMLKRVHCLGSCSLAPVVRVDEETYGRLTTADLEPLLSRYQAEGA